MKKKKEYWIARETKANGGDYYLYDKEPTKKDRKAWASWWEPDRTYYLNHYKMDFCWRMFERLTGVKLEYGSFIQLKSPLLQTIGDAWELTDD